MKLIYCPECGDIRNLIKYEWRYCHCEASGGQYEPDGWCAKIGGSAIPIGISNPDFQLALSHSLFNGKETPFKAFIFSRECPRIEYVEESEF